MSSHDNDGRYTSDRPPASNVAHLADEAAMRWLARLESSSTTEEEQAQFALWLAQDDAHKHAFDNMTLLWTGLGQVLKEQSDALELRFGDDFEGPRAKSTPTQAGRTRQSTVAGAVGYRSEGLTQPLSQSLSQPFAIAATSVAFAVAAMAVLLFTYNWSTRIETQVGEIAEHALTDGTIVNLNTDSEMRVRMTNDGRWVELVRGEAYFDIASDPGRPFLVRTRFGSVTAIGTAFAVRELPDSGMWVTVTEGRVVVSPATSPRSVPLDPGMRAMVNDEVAATPIDAPAATAWRHGTLVYDGVRIDSLIRDLNRYMPIRMSVVDDDLAAVEVSAILKLEDQEVMLNALAATFDLRWKRVTEKLILIRG